MHLYNASRYRRRIRLSSLALAIAASSMAHAAGLGHVRFLVVDPQTKQPVAGQVLVETASGTACLVTSFLEKGQTPVLDTTGPAPKIIQAGQELVSATTIVIPLGTSVTLAQQAEPPVKEFTIKVTATRIRPNQAPVGSTSTTRDKTDLKTFTNSASADSRNLTRGQKGVAEDSAGQQHIRGEHSDITFVVDGVMLPDTLSGRQGSVVVPSTIQSLEILTGGYAPEFGGQTAAVLNIATLPGARRARTDATFQAGSFNSETGDLTSVGPIGSKLSYVVDVSANQTDLAIEPQQPSNQDVHNHESMRNLFGKLRWTPSSRDSLTLTLSNNPDALQMGNRSGLPASFADVGQGFGFLGLRDANGVMPESAQINPGGLGSAPMVLPSQQTEGQDIFQHEVSEFAVLNWQRKVSDRDTAQLAFTALHSGQDLENNNPSADPLNLPVDNSIEYNPTATRNIHHVQLTGGYGANRQAHKIKLGFLLDAQSGDESYNVVPASQLALDELAALDPTLAPAGAATGAKDVNGNPVYVASSSQSPTLRVHRVGSYKAAYIQDTWSMSKKLTANYGFRWDWYNQNQNLGQESVAASEFSPRLNFSYVWDPNTSLHWAYNHLFNTPPLAQGAIVGQALQPEILNQYDVGMDHKLGRGQTVSLAYYYKQIKNQIDVGLLIPGSEIGLFSGVNFQEGAVHGVEFSYDIAPMHGQGFDGYFNYTLSSAQPNGKDNTGADVPDFNDHDQRTTIGAGLAYLWKGGASAALTVEYGSGLASSVVPPSTSRTPRTQVGLHAGTGDRLFGGRGGLNLDVENLFDDRTVINFQSGFSGTRFMMQRRILLSASMHF